jgi:hypothetical protein
MIYGSSAAELNRFLKKKTHTFGLIIELILATKAMVVVLNKGILECRETTHRFRTSKFNLWIYEHSIHLLLKVTANPWEIINCKRAVYRYMQNH